MTCEECTAVLREERIKTLIATAEKNLKEALTLLGNDVICLYTDAYGSMYLDANASLGTFIEYFSEKDFKKLVETEEGLPF